MMQEQEEPIELWKGLAIREIGMNVDSEYEVNLEYGDLQKWMNEKANHGFQSFEIEKQSGCNCVNHA
jgi:hypothetical protein